MRIEAGTLAHVAGICGLAFAAGCAGITDAGPRAAAAIDPAIVEPFAAVPPPLEPVTADVQAIESVPLEPAAVDAAVKAASAATPVARVPAQAAPARSAVEPQRRSAEAVPAVAEPVEPALDVTALKSRLRDTKAIGAFTKLALRNEMDDLLKLFRTQHQSGQSAGIAALRQPYNMLLLKVLSLIQDADPSLARTISRSREAIWGLLSDPAKFKSITRFEGKTHA